MADSTLFHKQMLEATQNITELHVAIAIASNPREHSETWQIVFDKDTQVASLQVVHRLVPVSRFNETLAVMTENYPDIVILGETYNTKPYTIGVKRLSDNDRKGSEIFIERLSSKENQAAIMRQSLQDDPMRMQAQLAALQAMPEELYRHTMQVQIKNALRSAYTEIPEAEAKKALDAFYVSESRQEIATRQTYTADVQAIVPKLKL